jgi:hypothetical protein
VVVTTGFWVRVGGFSQLIAGGNDTLLALGRLAGMYAALAALGGLLLAARPPADALAKLAAAMPAFVALWRGLRTLGHQLNQKVAYLSMSI